MSNIDKVYARLAPNSRAAREEGGVVKVYVPNAFTEKRVSGILKGVDVPYQVILDSSAYLEYFKSAEYNGPEMPENIRIKQTSPPKKAPIIICDQYDRTMTEGSFIVNSGNKRAYDHIIQRLEGIQGNQYPICLIGGPGSGKTSLLSYAINKAKEMNISCGYMDLQKLILRDMKGNKGVKNLPLEYMSRSLFTAVDGIEEIPMGKNSEWTRNFVYGLTEQGSTPGFFQLLSFTGDKRGYQEMIRSMPHEKLKDRLKKAFPVEIDYMGRAEYEELIKRELRILDIIKNEGELEKIAAYIDSTIPRDVVSTAREIGGYAQHIIAPFSLSRSEVTLEEIKVYLAQQSTITGDNFTSDKSSILSMAAKNVGVPLDKISKLTNSLEDQSKKTKLISEIFNTGITSPNEIGRMLGIKSHSTIIYHLKKAGLR